MNFPQIAEILKALSDAKRLQILDLIVRGTQCNCDFSEKLNIQPNLVSHHLRILKEAGLILVEKDTLDLRWKYYSVNPESFEILQSFFSEFFNINRIQPRQATCGPQNILTLITDHSSQTQ